MTKFKKGMYVRVLDNLDESAGRWHKELIGKVVPIIRVVNSEYPIKLRRLSGSQAELSFSESEVELVLLENV